MSAPRRAISRTAGRSGLTLVELSVSIVLAAILSLAVHALVQTGNKSSHFVNTETKSVRGLRKSSDQIARDLRQTSPSRLLVEDLSDANHQVTMQVPISLSNGEVTWGISEMELGGDDATRVRPGWKLRYTVVPVALPNRHVDRQLRRQILDADGKVVRQSTICHFLLPGDAKRPGFRVTQNGSMYHVTLFSVADPKSGELEVRNLSFDVAMRNQS